MNSLNITKLLLALVLLAFGGLIAISSYNNQKQITTKTRAEATWNQCQRPPDPPANTPCGSCAIYEINPNGGAATTRFGCELLCNTSGDPGNFEGCPEGSPPSYSITTTSWFWCREKGDHACSEGSPDLIASGPLRQIGREWTIPKQQTINDFQGAFDIQNYTECGRIQVDVAMNAPGISHAGAVKNSNVDCEPPPPPPPTCPYTDINTELKLSTEESWYDGNSMTNKNPAVPFELDVNCFADNGSMLVNPVDITINGNIVSDNGNGELRNYQITDVGTYSVTCKYVGAEVSACENTDGFTLVSVPTDAPTNTPLPPTDTPTNTPTDTPDTPTPTFTKTPTPTKTPTSTPTDTPVPTDTPIPTETLIPTETPIPNTPIPTNTPRPLVTLAPSNTPAPPAPIVASPTKVPPTATRVPTQRLEVKGQPPGGPAPWVFIGIPLTLLLLGLVL